MAKLRSAKAYRRIKRPYCRTSKKKKKNFIRGVPANKVVMYDMGAKSSVFSHRVNLISKGAVNLRHNAIESARVTANRYLGLHIKGSFAIKIRAVPHHIMREKPLATGAGADRFSQGMRRAYGKAIGRSAHVRPGKVLMTVSVNENGVNFAKTALKKAQSKFPISCSIVAEEFKGKQPSEQ
jgi:large subunit ribosomal protein L10e